MFSIHAFIQQDDTVKQFPLLFAVMFRRRNQDCVEILSSARDLIPALSFQSITLNFEQVVWTASCEFFYHMWRSNGASFTGIEQYLGR